MYIMRIERLFFLFCISTIFSLSFTKADAGQLDVYSVSLEMSRAGRVESGYFFPLSSVKTDVNFLKNSAKKLIGYYKEVEQVKLGVGFSSDLGLSYREPYYPIGIHVDLGSNAYSNPIITLRGCFFSLFSQLSSFDRQLLVTDLMENLYEGDKDILNSLYKENERGAKNFKRYQQTLKQKDFARCYDTKEVSYTDANASNFARFLRGYFTRLNIKGDNPLYRVKPSKYGTLALLLEPMYNALKKQRKQVLAARKDRLKAAMKAWGEQLLSRTVNKTWEIPLNKVNRRDYSNNLEYVSKLVLTYPNIGSIDGYELKAFLFTLDKILSLCRSENVVCDSIFLEEHLYWITFKTPKNVYKILEIK
ncbi:MAG: hypothetical protein DRR08_28640 [Candidatus Parabeggiatoa sp. nov. 2]|nr:MAG: hypothetical protein DRR08_28640 [Gammaproteobacteria bacterium]